MHGYAGSHGNVGMILISPTCSKLQGQNAHPRWHSSANTLSPAKGQSLQIQTGGDGLYILLIVVLRHTQSNGPIVPI